MRRRWKDQGGGVGRRGGEEERFQREGERRFLERRTNVLRKERREGGRRSSFHQLVSRPQEVAGGISTSFEFRGRSRPPPPSNAIWFNLHSDRQTERVANYQ